MLSSKNRKRLVILLSLLVVTAANAAPTMSDCSMNFSARGVFPGSDAHTVSASVLEISQIVESSDPHLASIAAEFLKPPTGFTDPPAPAIGAKSLPAVPGALFMALTGFFCVSLVKDHKIWLAALAALLWAGQAGFTALPQLASHLQSKKQVEQHASANITYACELEHPDRLRSELEGRQYIGLLYHLAGIPATNSSFTNREPAGSITLNQYNRKPYGKAVISPYKDTYTSQSAIIPERYSFNLLFNCLASRVEQFVCFSPAFMFDNLARGPPDLA